MGLSGKKRPFSLVRRRKSEGPFAPLTIDEVGKVVRYGLDTEGGERTLSDIYVTSHGKIQPY